MEDIVDRLESVNREFDVGLFYGAGDLSGHLTAKAGVKQIIHGDLHEKRLPASAAQAFVADEESAPLCANSLDLIVSILTLHTTNDLIGALSQYRAALKPDGLFIAAVFGGETLKSLREAFYKAETLIKNGVAPRIAPFASVKDFGAALQRAGFAMPVTDVDSVDVTYQNPMRMLADLRAMGETAVLKRHGPPLTRQVLQMAMKFFAEDARGTRFEIVYLTGWAPAPTQPKPLKPGQGKTSLADAVKAFNK